MSSILLDAGWTPTEADGETRWAPPSWYLTGAQAPAPMSTEDALLAQGLAEAGVVGRQWSEHYAAVVATTSRALGVPRGVIVGASSPRAPGWTGRILLCQDAPPECKTKGT